MRYLLAAYLFFVATVAWSQQSSRVVVVSDTAYAEGTWNGSTAVPTKNAICDKIETMMGVLQPIDADLTAVAALSGTGFAVHTAAGTWAERTITGTSNQISVANGDGVSGAPTLSLPADVLIPTVLTTPNSGLHILDTNATHDLIITPGSNLAADRVFTLTTGDAARTLDISAADVTISSFGATLVDDADASAARTTLGLSNTRMLQFMAFAPPTDVATGDGVVYCHVPPVLNGMTITYVHAAVITAGTTNTSDVQIARDRGGAVVDVLSTKLTIDSTETGSDTAAAAAVINASNDDLATNDRLRIDVDAVSTTAPKGLVITIQCAP